MYLAEVINILFILSGRYFADLLVKVFKMSLIGSEIFKSRDFVHKEDNMTRRASPGIFHSRGVRRLAEMLGEGVAEIFTDRSKLRAILMALISSAVLLSLGIVTSAVGTLGTVLILSGFGCLFFGWLCSITDAQPDTVFTCVSAGVIYFLVGVAMRFIDRAWPFAFI